MVCLVFEYNRIKKKKIHFGFPFRTSNVPLLVLLLRVGNYFHNVLSSSFQLNLSRTSFFRGNHIFLPFSSCVVGVDRENPVQTCTFLFQFCGGKKIKKFSTVVVFIGNPVSTWAEVCKLGRAFPNLESLVLAECPLQSLMTPPPSPDMHLGLLSYPRRGNSFCGKYEFSENVVSQVFRFKKKKIWIGFGRQLFTHRRAQNSISFGRAWNIQYSNIQTETRSNIVRGRGVFKPPHNFILYAY